MGEKYYLGLDMGTATVGWAVTNERYELLRRKGKDLWGVRLFKEAETSAGRRTNRISKRRLSREKARIGYLRELFAAEIEKVDAGFYQRLADSKYFPEDKNEKQPFALFAGKDFTDKEYYQKYPTIFHLRKELLESKEPHDVRLVYLALLNMYKHRGHFLNANMEDTGVNGIKESYQQLTDMAGEYLELELPLLEDTSKLEDILATRKLSNTQKHEKVMELLGYKKTDKQVSEMLKFVCGLSGNLSKLYGNHSFSEEDAKFNLSFRDGNFEEKWDKAESMLTPEELEVFLALKRLHDAGMLANIMKGEKGTYQYLSLARVDAYEKHQKDLQCLKRVLKKDSMKKYNDMFRVMQENNYSAYVGSVNAREGVIRRNAKCTAKDFFEKVKKLVEETEEGEDRSYILAEIEKGTFLPKQLTASNGIIPNQIHKAEMKQILANAEEYLPFLKEKDESGYSASQRILMMFSFQIPYYIGPLTGGMEGNSNSKNVWSVRKESGKIYPWNFPQKVDEQRSAEKFIERMVNHCTYLNDEQVLPKNSLLYERFLVLNELNNLRINGERVSVELKQKIYEELFRTGKKITANKLKNYLQRNGYCQPHESVEFSGIDGDFTNRLSSYAKFREIFGVEVLSYQQEQMAEKIIFWATVYGDTQSFLRKRIQEEYGEYLSPEQIKRITYLKFRDWGKLSRELLETEGADCETGEIDTVIGRLWNENYNLMELIAGSRFTYKAVIEEKQRKIEKSLKEIEYEDLEELYISAPVKRMVWQTILILKEIVKVMGCEPTKVFVEMARDADAKKERTVSRKKKLLELYKACRKEEPELFSRLNRTEEQELRGKKLYLYYKQKGVCMYSGEKIDIQELFNKNLYDIDHIYPRHFVKDDSIENNLVLVKKELNAHKTDVFPIEQDIRSKMMPFWRSLEEGGFITGEKFKRLTRTEPFSDEERAGFISRQLVETRQGTKVIADLFSKSFEETRIIYVKAGNVSDFRKKFDLLKCRSINDFHHANDAYLNIVVGNVYDTKFTQNPLRFIKEYRKNPQQNVYHMDKMFEYDVTRNGECAWRTGEGKSIAVVKAMMKKNTPLVTYMNYEAHGMLTDQNLISAKTIQKAGGKGYLPIKTTDEKLSDTCKYGGYNKIAGAYFFLVEHTVKKQRVRTLEPVPIYLKDKLDTKEKLEEYCKETLGYLQPSVRRNRILMYSLIQVDGFYLYLTGRSGNQLSVWNAVQLVLDRKWYSYVRALEKMTQTDITEENTELTAQKNQEFYDLLTQKHSKEIYGKRPNPVGDKLRKGRERFCELDLRKQAEVLLQILQLSQIGNTGANLKEIGESAKTGVCFINKKISEKTQFYLINQSVTGLYETKTDLLTV